MIVIVIDVVRLLFLCVSLFVLVSDCGNIGSVRMCLVCIDLVIIVMLGIVIVIVSVIVSGVVGIVMRDGLILGCVLRCRSLVSLGDAYS